MPPPAWTGARLYVHLALIRRWLKPRRVCAAALIRIQALAHPSFPTASCPASRALLHSMSANASSTMSAMPPPPPASWAASRPLDHTSSKREAAGMMSGCRLSEMPRFTRSTDTDSPSKLSLPTLSPKSVTTSRTTCRETSVEIPDGHLNQFTRQFRGGSANIQGLGPGPFLIDSPGSWIDQRIFTLFGRCFFFWAGGGAGAGVFKFFPV